MWYRTIVAAVVAITVSIGPLSLAWSTVPIYQGEKVTFDLSGYVRNLSGVQRTTYDTMGFIPEDIGLSLSVVRFAWHADLGDFVGLDIHNRFYWSVLSSDASLGSTNLGIGATASPDRTVDLESTIVEEGSLRMTHDIDRLVLRFYTEPADIVLGRQAITWGIANLFSVADMWTQFSPFDLDTSQKPGIDAIRVITMPADIVELDFVVADKGDIEDLSGGVRANFWLGSYDLYVAVAKNWNEIVLATGLTRELDQITLRLDGLVPFNIDDTEVDLPRLTAGFDYFSGDVVLTVEYHFNGTGVTESDEYLGHFESETFSRGESYFLGQHYAGAAVSYTPWELFTVSMSVISNLTDPSVIIATTASYSVAQDVDLSLGAYNGFGKDPVIALPPALGSEFGTYPDMYYLLFAAYF